MPKYKFEDGSQLGVLGREMMNLDKEYESAVDHAFFEDGLRGGNGFYCNGNESWTVPKLRKDLDKAKTTFEEKRDALYLKMLDLLEEDASYNVYDHKRRLLGVLEGKPTSNTLTLIPPTDELITTCYSWDVGAFLKKN